MRVDESATDAVRVAAQQKPESGTRLKAAWTATFRRDPDLSRAYSDCVLAVEAAACPVLIPNTTTPTLGKAIAHLRDAQEQ